MCLFLDLHRVLEEGVRSHLLFLDGFFGLGGKDLFLLCQFVFLDMLGLEPKLFDEQHEPESSKKWITICGMS
jgi:hypothetical protein